MKILHLNTYDNAGGAARAVYRLHRALLAAGAESQMLVRFKGSKDTDVLGDNSMLGKTMAVTRRVLERLPVRLYPRRRQMLFSPAWLPFSGMVEAVNRSDADLVHLHWICKGLLRIEDLAAIRKPLVWSLHDMWAFTGGCHCDEGCGKYRQQCGACPVLGSNAENDLSARVFGRKQECFARLDFTVIGPSRWLAGCAAESALLRDKRIVNLPNLLDTDEFKPMDKTEARKQMRLPLDKKIIVFGAIGGADDPNKGFSELTLALKVLKTENVELAVFGGGQPPQTRPELQFPQHYLGYLHDDARLRALYSAANVMVVPSRQEAFGQTACEALSCGTPVVAFKSTGLLDIIEHQQNGYLARAYDPADLAAGIDWVLAHPEPALLAHNARDKVLRCFDAKVVAGQYIRLYEEVLGMRKNPEKTF